MSKSMKQILVLAAVQSVRGTPVVPVPGTNAILARATTPSLINAEFVDRALIRPYKGSSPQLAVGVHRTFECEVELAGSGAAGTVPKFDPLLKACGFASTVTAGTSVVYTPVSTGEPLLTLYCYLDGLLFTMTDTNATVSIELNAKQIPVMKFKFMGNYSDATDVLMPTGVVYTGFTQPVTVGKDNTPTFTVHGVAAACSALSFDLAAQQTYRDIIGFKGAISPDRKPAGSMTIELDTIASKNWGLAVKQGAQGALQLVHGTSVGNIVQIDAPALQISSAPTIQDQDSVAMLSMNFMLPPSAGNDELILTFK